METVKNPEDIKNLKENKVIGEITLEKSEIKFYGVNNIFYCESGIKLKNSNINFVGNNSIVYLSYTDKDYVLEVYVRHDSTIFIGKNNELGAPFRINVQESQNLIIGEDKYMFRIYLVNRCQHIIRTRIHSLTALYDIIHAKLPENFI